jgi:hypothetical protein
MPWDESVSPSFRARHDSAHADEADRVLYSLERTRARLAALFPRTVDDVTVVLHRSTASLTFANPSLPLTWLATAPAARRYVGGRARPAELHVLAPAALEARASSVPGSREMLALTAAALYARRVILENNHNLYHVHGPARLARELRWAWLLEGAARWFSGQTDHARPAIARRLHEGGPLRFPPGMRDAPLLGGTVIDLLVRELGEPAAVQLACRLHPRGARAALSSAFEGAPVELIDRAWRSHLTKLATGAA